MYVNIEGLNTALPYLNNAKDYLNDSASLFYIKEIPEDYKYLIELQHMPSSLIEIGKTVEEAANLLAKQIDAFETSEKKNTTEANKLSDSVSTGTIEGTGSQVATSVGANTKTDVTVENLNNNNLSATPEETSMKSGITIDSIDLTTVKTLNYIATYLGTGFDLSDVNNAFYYFKKEDGSLVTVGSAEYANCMQNDINLDMVKTSKYDNIKQTLIDKYAIKDETEACKVISLMGNSQEKNMYSAIAEKIVEQFKSMPEEFEKQFGFSLYTTNASNEQVVNGEALYADLFINLNLEDAIVKDESGKNIVNTALTEADKYMTTTLKQGLDVKKEGILEKIINAINNYLKSKKTESGV